MCIYRTYSVFASREEDRNQSWGLGADWRYLLVLGKWDKCHFAKFSMLLLLLLERRNCWFRSPNWSRGGTCTLLLLGHDAGIHRIILIRNYLLSLVEWSWPHLLRASRHLKKNKKRNMIRIQINLLTFFVYFRVSIKSCGLMSRELASIYEQKRKVFLK